MEGSLPGQGRKHHSQVNYIESSEVLQCWLSRDVGKARSNLSIRIKSRWYSNADIVEWSGVDARFGKAVIEIMGVHVVSGKKKDQWKSGDQ